MRVSYAIRSYKTIVFYGLFHKRGNPSTSAHSPLSVKLSDEKVSKIEFFYKLTPHNFMLSKLGLYAIEEFATCVQTLLPSLFSCCRPGTMT